MNLLIVSLLVFVGVLNLIVGLAVLSRNVRKPLNVSFFALAASCAAWVLGIAAFLSVNEMAAALNWAKFYYIAPILLVASSVAFADAFPSNGKINLKKFLPVCAGFLALAIPIVTSSHFLFNRLVYKSWGKAIILNKWQYAVYSVYLATAFILTLVPIYKKRSTEKGLYKTQVSIFFDGYLVSCVLGVFFNLILPALGNYRLVWLGPIASCIYVVATAYGIIRHRLFDLRIVAARSVGYLLSILALGLLYGIGAFTFITAFLHGPVGSVASRAVSAALAVLLALVFRPIKTFFDRFTNRLFYRDAYSTQAFIDEFDHILVSSIEVKALLGATVDLVQQTLKSDYCSFVLFAAHGKVSRIVGEGSEKRVEEGELELIHRFSLSEDAPRAVIVDYLSSEERDMQLRLQRHDIAAFGIVKAKSASASSSSTLGYLLLGPKKSGNPYNNQDLKLIGVVTSELVIAIQNALRFEEIEKFNATLQERIEEATRKLRNSNEKLRNLDQTKDDFISMASHQLRTPLTSVKGYVSMVLDGDAGPINPMQRKLLEQSFTSAQRMVYLIADLLNISRLKTGKFVIELSPANLAQITKDEISQLVETAKSRGLELTYDKPQNFPTYMMDTVKTRQVIMNFVDNAIYYTPSGGHIHVELKDTPKTIELRVIDDGIGVPKHLQHHLFTKFYRAPNAQKARPDGTGLGLFMAKKVIVAQGGALIFRSAEGQGSTFGFSFAKSHLTAPPDSSIRHAI